MRTFLIWADKGPEIKNLMLKLKKHGHEIVYWVGSTGGEKDKLPETVFHEHLQAVAGLPAENIDIIEFPPPGEDLIKKMYKTESIILTMMNKRYDKMCLDERRHLYYNMLQYWHGVIKKYKPEIIVFQIIPHTIFNYIIYELARLLNIKTIMFDDTWVSDRALLYAGFWQGSNKLQQKLENNKNKNFSLNDLANDLQEYYKKHISGDLNTTPAYMEEIKKKYSVVNRVILFRIKALLISIKNFTVFEKILTFLFRMFKEDIKKEYVNF